jgi:hypothetical protein
MTGRCGCGAVSFEVGEPLGTAYYCHCTRCQHRTGTAMQGSARVAPGSVTLTAGEEHVRAWWPGDGFEKVFCGECGSALFARDPGVRPSYHQFVAYAAPWEPLPDDGLPRYDESAPG